MSAIACSIALQDAGYPPVRKTALDLQNEKKLAALKAQAPFGRGPNGNAVTAAQYYAAMQKQIGDASAIDFTWPFWTGLTLGAVGLVLLVVHRR